MAEIKKMGYCVNGEWKESKAEKYMDVTDSSTGEVIAQVPCCCLLYTSPSPRDMRRSRMPSSA